MERGNKKRRNQMARKGRRKGEILYTRKQSGSFFRPQPRHGQGPDTGNEETDGTADGFIENMGPSATKATGHADKPTMATTNERTPTSSGSTNREQPRELEDLLGNKNNNSTGNKIKKNQTVHGPKTKGTTNNKPMQRKEKGTKKISIGCWNIRRGLLRREQELRELIKQEELDILFLVETDTTAIANEEDYKIDDLSTILPKRNREDGSIRIIGLVKKHMKERINKREDLMDEEFPSIWLEIKNENRKGALVCGFYREWTREGDNTQERQIRDTRILSSQIERATKEDKHLVVMGDANLCSKKWKDPEYIHRKIAEEMLDTLDQCGLENIELGDTYLADRLNKEGLPISSALDHVYMSSGLIQNSTVKKIEVSSTDHVPIIARIQADGRCKQEKRTITKRSMKNFNSVGWNESLAKQDWEKLGGTEDVNEMVKYFTEAVVSSLDECAPIKTFTLKPCYVKGITEETKKMMKERDATRKKINKASPMEKKTLHEKYKRLRNRTTAQMRRDKIRMNAERIEKAKDVNETWRIVKEINNPKQESAWKIKNGDVETVDEKEIANTFNKFFVDKVANLKQNIDLSIIKDPLEKLKKKMEGKNLKFSLKPVSEKTVKKAMDKMKKKTSSGKDGLSQECLLIGRDILKIPLTRIINNSIENGIFPNEWKEAIVAPILKKGDPSDKNNYRPISCLVTASKVMEKVVCNQLTKFLEVHGLLPENQHGFRQKRSTMTALTAMQKEWVQSTEDGLITGILVWDLSAAYDTIDTELLCQKLRIFGCDKNTCSWFRSFLTGRTQRVRIGQAMSEPLKLESGLPQGGILSPIIFTVYGADLEEWLKHSKAFNYADDTSTISKGKKIEEVMANLTEDAGEVLSFMASNGLVANPKKTVFMVMNYRIQEKEDKTNIMVGQDKIIRSSHTKLLGVEIQENQKWGVHLKNLKNALNHRLFQIRRIANQLPKEHMMKVVHSIWFSKLRYGLQLCAHTRLNVEDSHNTEMKSIQVAQNRLLRMMYGCTIKDRISTKIMLEKLNLPSVNQLAIEVKLTEVWKSLNDPSYPMKMDRNLPMDGATNRPLRPTSMRELKDNARTKIGEESFGISAARMWNQIPTRIKDAKTLAKAKKEIKEFCKTRPI